MGSLKKRAVLAVTFTAICMAIFGSFTTRDELREKQRKAHEAADIIRSLGYAEDSEIIKELQNRWWSYENEIKARDEAKSYTEDDVVMLSKVAEAEAGGLDNTEKSAVVWCVLNRCDNWEMSIYEAVISPGQFAYYSGTEYTDDTITLVRDVLERWDAEKSGEDSGRTLPKAYMWFSGDGEHNYFRDAFTGGSVWDWTLESPYK